MDKKQENGQHGLDFISFPRRNFANEHELQSKASAIWLTDALLLQVFDSSFQSRRGGGMASGGGGSGIVPAFALGLSTTGLLEPTRVSGGGGEEHQVHHPGSKAPKGEVRSVCAYRVRTPTGGFYT